MKIKKIIILKEGASSHHSGEISYVHLYIEVKDMGVVDGKNSSTISGDFIVARTETERVWNDPYVEFECYRISNSVKWGFEIKDELEVFELSCEAEEAIEQEIEKLKEQENEIESLKKALADATELLNQKGVY